MTFASRRSSPQYKSSLHVIRPSRTQAPTDEEMKSAWKVLKDQEDGSNKHSFESQLSAFETCLRCISTVTQGQVELDGKIAHIPSEEKQFTDNLSTRILSTRMLTQLNPATATRSNAAATLNSYAEILFNSMTRRPEIFNFQW